MKSAEQWQEELAGETSVESIRRIQIDALTQAMLVLLTESQLSPDQHVKAYARQVIDELDKLLPIS